MIKILFVCHGNICRSPMAEFVMKDIVNKKGVSDLFEIESAACTTEEIGNDMYPPAKRKLRKEGIPFSPRHARQVTQRDYRYYDYIIYMDRENQYDLNWFYKDDPDKKIYPLLPDRSVADPWYTGNFDVTYDDVREGCLAWLDKLLSNNV